MVDDLNCKTETETQMQRTNVWTPSGESTQRWGGMNWQRVSLCIK